MNELRVQEELPDLEELYHCLLLVRSSLALELFVGLNKDVNYSFLKVMNVIALHILQDAVHYVDVR
jgi:hypothetical protein